jgi:hypothetical protein
MKDKSLMDRLRQYDKGLDNLINKPIPRYNQDDSENVDMFGLGKMVEEKIYEAVKLQTELLRKKLHEYFPEIENE